MKTAIVMEVPCMLVCLVLIFGCYEERARSGNWNRMFVAMLVTNIVGTACDMMTWIWENNAHCIGLLYVCDFMVYECNYVLMLLFNVYLLKFLNYDKKMRQLFMATVIGLCVIETGVVASSFWTGLVFRFEGAYYSHGSFFWLSEIFPIIIIMGDAVLLILNQKRVGNRATLSFLSFGLFPLIAMGMQITFDTYGLPIMSVATTLSLLTVFVMIYLYQVHEVLQKEAELQRLNNAILISQIQPHFLFNALCVIQDMTHDKAPEAEAATIEFSRFLRGNLDSLTSQTPIPFEKVLQHTKSYLSIEQLRFGDKLHIEYDIRETAFSMPSLSLQPMVENAVRHGICKRENGGTVWISTAKKDGFFVVTVRDDGVGFDVAAMKSDGKKHIGLKNVRDRVNTMCHGTLDVESTIGVGTTVTIKIPEEQRV